MKPNKGSSAEAESPPHQGLRLEQALQLLRHSGMAPSRPAAVDDAWLQNVLDALVEISSRDPLTGLANRRSFELALSREIDRVARLGQTALLLILDIDHFKQVNDLHGHLAGDEVLRGVAFVLREAVRPMDLVGRVGGEEFAVLMPNCTAADGQRAAERIRRKIAQLQVPMHLGPPLSVTVSIGGALAPPWVRSSPKIWMARADMQLYAAKDKGRNRVCLEAAPRSDMSKEEQAMLHEVPGAAAPQ